MKVSGFTIVRNAVRYGYPFLESIRSILPICDEFVVNCGDSDDNTSELIEALARMWPNKIRVIHQAWDMRMGKEVLSFQTNKALEACQGDWAFYLQSDEVIHERDWPRLRRLMIRYADDLSVDALRFSWLHFYGSYYRYRVDRGWYQKQDRIVRCRAGIESFGDAFAFRRKDGQPLRSVHTRCLLYHYGWVQAGEIMAQRRKNAEAIGFARLNDEERTASYDYGDLNRFPVYFGSHPAEMKERVAAHELTQRDGREIRRRYWWHPYRWLRPRVKTPFRVKHRIEETASPGAGSQPASTTKKEGTPS